MVLPDDVVMHVTDNIKANGGKVRLADVASMHARWTSSYRPLSQQWQMHTLVQFSVRLSAITASGTNVTERYYAVASFAALRPRYGLAAPKAAAASAITPATQQMYVP